MTCTMSDSCLLVGNVAEPNWPMGSDDQELFRAAGCNNCNYPMIENNASQHTHFVDMRSVNLAPSATKPAGIRSGSLIQVDNDQSAVIDGLDTAQSRWSHRATTFCSVGIKGVGEQRKCGHLTDQEHQHESRLLSARNEVDNQNANAMRISDSVIQSRAQFRVRSTGFTAMCPMSN